jgi:iron complex outermembrane recepter protein
MFSHFIRCQWASSFQDRVNVCAKNSPCERDSQPLLRTFLAWPGNHMLKPMALIPFVFLLSLFGSLQNGRAQNLGSDPTASGSLKELSLEELGNLEVTTASKEPEKVRKVPAAIYVVTQEDIRRSGASSLPEVLRLVPGVEVAQVDSDHWSVAIRGFGAVLESKLLVLIDGRSVYTPLFAGVYWEAQATPIEDIERIEVIRGPGGTVWGANAVNGIINIITKSAKETHGSMVSVGGGNVDQGTTTVRYGGGNGKGLDYRFYGLGFVRGPEFHGGGTNFDEWRMGQAGFRTDWSRNARDTFTLQGDIYDEGAGETTTFALYSPPSQVTADGTAKLAGGNLLGRWKRVVNDKSDFQIQAYYDRTRHFEPEFGETRDTFDIDFLDHLRVTDHQDLLWGFGARVSPASFVQRVPTIDFLPHHLTDQIYSGFLQDEIAFFDNRIELTVGSKLEHNNYSGFEVQPSGRVLWNVSSKQALWVAVTRAVRTPSRIEDDVQLTDFATTIPLPIYLRVYGNKQEDAEALIAYEAGYRTLATAHFHIDVAVFHNDYNNLSSFQVEAPFLEPSPAPVHAVLPLLTSNGIRGTTNGLEIATDWRPSPWWELKASYAYLTMDLKDKLGSNDPTSVGKDEGASPHNQWVIQSLVNLPKKLELDQTYRYVSALPAEMVGSYGTAEARIGWHFARQAELSIVAHNLLQPHHAEFGGDPGGLVGIKRSVYAKLVWHLDEK